MCSGYSSTIYRNVSIKLGTLLGQYLQIKSPSRTIPKISLQNRQFGFLLDLLGYQGMRGRTCFQQNVWTEISLISPQSYCSQWAWSGKHLLTRHYIYVGINQAEFGPSATCYHKVQILKIVTFLQVKIQQKQELTKYKPFINKNLWLDQYFK